MIDGDLPPKPLTLFPLDSSKPGWIWIGKSWKCNFSSFFQCRKVNRLDHPTKL